MNTYLCTPGPGFWLRALLCLIMVGWAGVERGASARLFVAVTVGPRLYLSAADRQIVGIAMQRGRAVCLGWLWHPPLGGILMSSPGTSISHLTSCGEQGHPDTHLCSLKPRVDTHTPTKHMNSRKNATGLILCTLKFKICGGLASLRSGCHMGVNPVEPGHISPLNAKERNRFVTLEL